MRDPSQEMSLARRFRQSELTAGDLSGFKEEIMKRFRVILVCTLLLSAAVPTFAAPPCQFCLTEAGPCVNDSGGLRCRTIGGVCQELSGVCIGFSSRPVLGEWQVASIEITRPDPATKVLTTVVISPTAVAQHVKPLLVTRQ
jgi:hypothetical protein